MQRLLLSIILALFLALTMVGIKRVVRPANTAQPVMMATGGAPVPIPW